MKIHARIPVGLTKALLFLIAFLLFTVSVLPQEIPPYKNSKLPLEQRVADLLSRMTLEEKIAQVSSAMSRTVNASDPKSSLVDAKGAFLPERASALIKNGIGQISRPSMLDSPRRNAEFTNSIQKWARENTRLGIPVMFHEECLHGLAAQKGTSFPQAIALASTWDPEIVEDVFSATASEVRARGSQQCLTPVLDIARDPRWGRTEETYGEDPYLGSRIGVAAVKGFQGTGPYIDKSHVIATAKHFAGYAAVMAGREYASVDISARTLEEVHFPPFSASIGAGVAAIMPAFVDLAGVPMTAHRDMLDGILRRRWGFDGVIVSDFGAVGELIVHGVAADATEAASLALNAGVDIDMVSEDLDSSDQKSFQGAGAPAVQFFSGPHSDYHRPMDTADKIDAASLVKVASVTREVADYLAKIEKLGIKEALKVVM